MLMTCLIATLGYRLAGWDWIDSIYMVTITIFGVGYGEVNSIDETWLKVFTIVIIFAGCSSLIYVIGGIVQMLTEGEIERMLGNRVQTREIDQLSDHTIICGYGRVGQMLAEELQLQGESLVVLDRNPDRVQLAIDDGFPAMVGDAVGDDTLQQVGLLRARAFATVLPDDATNVFITLTARDLNESIRIIARAESPCTERKLMRSGATNVVMPAAIGAMRIAQLAMADVEDSSLPEQRYRMLATDIRPNAETEESRVGKPVPPIATPHADAEHDVVLDEVKQLGDMATDLTRTVAKRHLDHVIEREKQEHPQQ
tara:strand:+ start:816685 stop:817623 length:939 start_codon:yes stop_codon:yes gene_type:complete